MQIQLTEPQQRALDATGNSLPEIIDPRTNTAYILVPTNVYDAVREIIEDEKRQKHIRQTGLRNAIGRMKDEP